MVIFYKIDTKEIMYTEKETVIPTLPIGTIEKKKELLEKQGMAFIGVDYEMDIEIFNYKVSFDEEGNFIGLEIKESEVI